MILVDQFRTVKGVEMAQKDVTGMRASANSECVKDRVTKQEDLHVTTVQCMVAQYAFQ